MKNSRILNIICLSILSLIIITGVSLYILGNKTRVGYLTNFDLNLYSTLKLNNINITEAENLFKTENVLNKKELTNYVLTNELITNYNYNLRIRYYSKIFGNSDIYSVHVDTNKIIQDNNFITEITFNEGSPFGYLVSKKQIDFNKIDNINYKLSLKVIVTNLVLLSILFLLIFIFYKKINITIYYTLYFVKNKIIILLYSLLFFVLMLFSEITLFNNEISKEFLYSVTDKNHPYYFLQTSVFFNKSFLENTNNYSNRLDINKNRRNIKDNFGIYVDQYTDNHVLGNIYAALKTGKNLQELRSHNFNSPIGEYYVENMEFVSKEYFNIPTLYASLPLFITKIIYNLIPIKYIDTLEKELQASSYINNIKIFFIFIHIFLWSLLIYVVGVKFGLIYSIIISFSVFFFPGSSVIMPVAYKSSILVALFPLYILTFYDFSIVNTKKKIFFYIGLGVLIFFQWSLCHWLSLVFQLPIILLTFLFCNFYYQLKGNKIENLLTLKNIILFHIKKYVLYYIGIILYASIITLLVLFISYKEMLKLQPENRDRINKLVWDRPQGSTSKLSFVLLKEGWEKNPEKYYPTYSFNNFVKHNVIVLDRYLDMPVVYPLWRLEYFLHRDIVDKLYTIIKYFDLYIFILISFVLNIFIIIKYKEKIYNLVIPLLFFISIFVWLFLFSNLMPRVATHFSLYPNIIGQYFSVIIFVYLTYLLYLIKSNKK